MRRLEQTALLAEPPLVLLEQRGDVDRQPELVRDRLGERDVSLRPRNWLGPVQGEHTDHAVVDDDRRGEDSTAAEPFELGEIAVRGVAKLRCLGHVGDRHRPALAGGHVRHGQALGRVADRLEPF